MTNAWSPTTVLEQLKSGAIMPNTGSLYNEPHGLDDYIKSRDKTDYGMRADDKDYIKRIEKTDYGEGAANDYAERAEKPGDYSKSVEDVD